MRWSIGAWGECVTAAAAAGGAWSSYVGNPAEQCDLVQSRAISCVGKAGDGSGRALTDADCLQHFIKPAAERVCYGACGVQLPCETLNWEPPVRDSEVERQSSYAVCGSGGGLGGTVSSSYYDHEGGGRAYFSGCYTPQTFPVALGVCHQNGARLCTVEEMARGDTAKGQPGGGMCPGDFFWTSTKCAGEQGRFVAGQGGQADLSGHGSLGKHCARANATSANEMHSVACCSEWSSVDLAKQHADFRKIVNVHRGNYTWCNGLNGQNGPCWAYDGHCRNNHDCRFGTICAVGAGAKYGLFPGSGVCIPAYDKMLPAFWPQLVYRGQPTTLVFLERGGMPLPTTAEVRATSQTVTPRAVGCNPAC